MEMKENLVHAVAPRDPAARGTTASRSTEAMLVALCSIINTAQQELHERFQIADRLVDQLDADDEGWQRGWAEGIALGYRNALCLLRDLTVASGLPLNDGDAKLSSTLDPEEQRHTDKTPSPNPLEGER